MPAPDPAAWGISTGHHHVRGDWVPAPERGVAAALAAMGAIEPGPPPSPTWVVRRDAGLEVPWEATLRTEDGSRRTVHGTVRPEDLPLGYHTLCGPDGDVRLIVSPGTCPLPARAWGWAVQLYAARSAASWGMGDLADLRTLARWTAAHGGGVVLINPLHGVAPAPHQEPSPYYPASRRWRNPLYLRVEEVPGADAVDLGPLPDAGRALNADRRIDRDRVWRLKREALARIWSVVGPSPAFEGWAAAQGDTLTGWAAWAAISDELGPDWRNWPPALASAHATGVAAWAAAHRDQVAFHAWLQWLLELQLRDAAGMGVAVVADLAIGADPAGADGWQWADVIAHGVSVGAPPDEFSPAGQDWGFPPFDPWRLRAAGYEPFAQIVRAALAGGGGVRIDHVAGLARLFWVPDGGRPADGVYVHYPWEDLLNVVALEATRAGAFVVGEDLGTVEPWLRDALARWRILSYKLLWFEEAPPAWWPPLALAAVTTHDLPTISGVWNGTDLAARRTMGVEVDEDAERSLRRRLEQACAVPEASGPDREIGAGEAVLRAYAAIAETPALLVTATLDDALGVEERPNQPGTTGEWPNWSLALPEPLEAVLDDPGVLRLGEVLASGRGAQSDHFGDG